MNFSAFKSYFDERFSHLLDEKINSFVSYSDHRAVHGIAAYCKKIAADGKRFRPYMAYVGYQAYGGKDDIFPALAALELLHIFALVHDDIMDRAALRHGVATIHTAYAQKYPHRVVGDGIAILAGDLFFAWSYDLLQGMHPAEMIHTEFATLISEVIHGQMMDVVFSAEEPQTLDAIEQKMILKTAHYSFFRPLHIGALLADDSDTDGEFIRGYATNLGLAFQVQDDLLDVLPSSQTGKSSFTDIKDAQQTVLSWYMFTRAADADRAIFLDLYGKKTLTTSDEVTLSQALEDSGAIAYAEEKVASYLDAASALALVHRPGEQLWLDIIELVKSRRS